MLQKDAFKAYDWNKLAHSLLDCLPFWTKLSFQGEKKQQSKTNKQQQKQQKQKQNKQKTLTELPTMNKVKEKEETEGN